MTETAEDTQGCAPDQESSLLQLPPELRNYICELALITDGEVSVERGLTYQKRTALLETCSIVRKECGGIFYADNTFCIKVDGGGFLHVEGWIKHVIIGGGKAHLLQSLKLRLELSQDGQFEIEQHIWERSNKYKRGDEYACGGHRDTPEWRYDCAGCGSLDAEEVISGLEELWEAGFDVGALEIEQVDGEIAEYCDWAGDYDEGVRSTI